MLVMAECRLRKVTICSRSESFGYVSARRRIYLRGGRAYLRARRTGSNSERGYFCITTFVPKNFRRGRRRKCGGPGRRRDDAQVKPVRAVAGRNNYVLGGESIIYCVLWLPKRSRVGLSQK